MPVVVDIFIALDLKGRLKKPKSAGLPASALNAFCTFCVGLLFEEDV
jgi:hypothetical protein